jgi:uncharacterized protein YyaL (SSP411 family)
MVALQLHMIPTMMAKTALILGVLAALAAAKPEAPDDPQPHRLSDETSPYLLRHADNPVHWWPWGPEAFAAAREQDKPIFLSVGYSTCYWCHVMERESFENPQVAALLNEGFICIKVDREERPDIDDVYVTAVQAMTGQGGWPLTVFLEPGSLKPFLGGTYFPAQARGGRPSFTQLLGEVRRLWTSDRAWVSTRADDIADRVQRTLARRTAVQPLTAETVQNAVTGLMSAYDPEFGGFRRGRPKFPLPVQLELLTAVAWGDAEVRAAVVNTLNRMAMGGIYDQIGGGFHRYSVDQFWLVPHFEKMLYDNAQLASVYAEAYARTGDPFYARVTEETLDYVLRELTSAEGAFFSAQDAEANEREGWTYVWTADQVKAALSRAGLDEYVDFALEIYGMKRGGNFVDPRHPEDGRRSVLHLPQMPSALAFMLGLTEEEFQERRALVNAALLAARDQREQPLTDDKVLAGWNGLMIKAMVDGAEALGQPRYREAAEQAATFVLRNMRTDDGGLRRSWRAGTAKVDGFSSDYAHFVRGLLALYRATNDPAWLDRAAELMAVAAREFRDQQSGVYYNTPAGREDLFVRVTSTRDGVIPSANSVMLVNLLDLHELSGRDIWLDDASALLSGLSSRIYRSPRSMTLAMAALDRMLVAYPDLVPGAESAPEPSPPPAPPPHDPVEVALSRTSLAVTPQAPGRFDVTLTIDEGHHVNAHEPGVKGLTGLTVQAVGRGWAVDVAYPAAEALRNELFADDLLVYTGSVTLPVTVRQVAPEPGRLHIVLTYQACTDRACLEPVRTLLPITIVHPGAADDDRPAAAHFDHAAFGALLARHVDAEGGVDYTALQRDTGALDAYLQALADAPLAELDRNERLALLINAYNAFTLRLILDEYPVKSIKDIPASKRWDDRRWNVGGSVWSLDQIEHEQIRAAFDEPRIHFALVCGAVGCPPLRREAYAGDRLEAQLEAQARTVHADERWFRYDRAANVVWLTKLYDWYRDDFVDGAASVTAYAARYAPALKEALDAGLDPTVRWLDYDWTLNDRQPADG